MSNFQLDLTAVENTLNRRSYKLSEVQDKIEKVAFDVCRFRDGKADELWRIEEGNDGPYIVALYKDEDKVATASASPWSILVKNADLHVFYKNEHFCKVAGSSLGFEDNDLNLAKRYLPATLASNKNLVKNLLKTINPDTAKTFLSKYPELAQ